MKVEEILSNLEATVAEAEKSGSRDLTDFLRDVLAELDKLAEAAKDNEELTKRIEELAEKVKKLMSYYYPYYGKDKNLKYYTAPYREAVLTEAKQDGNGLVWEARLIQAGLSRNNRFYPPDVLEKSASKFDGVKCYVDHVLNTNGLPRSVRDLVGWFENPRWNAEAKSIDATFIALSQSPIVGILQEAFDKNKPDLIGFSICATATARPRVVDGRRVFYIESLDDIISVDVVTEPAAGGRVLRLYESAMIPIPEEEEVKMEEVKMEEVQEQVIQEEIPPKVDLPEVENPVLQLEKEEDQGKEDVEAAKKELELIKFQLMLEQKLKNEPQYIAEMVKERFADRVATEEEVDNTIKKIKEWSAKMVEENRVAPVKVTYDEFEKKLAALEGLLSGKMVDGVRPFKSLHESYCRLNGIDPWSVSKDQLANMILRDIASAKFTSEITEAVSWSDAFGVALHRILMKDYEMPYLNEWREIVSDIVSLSDMRTHNIIRIGYYSTLPQVSGTYTEPASPGDEAVSLTPAKYGRLESYTWEDALNDDVNALRKIPQRLSLAAKWTIYKSVFDILDTNATCDYDSTALIASAHANRSTSTLSVTAVAEGFAAMLSQSAPSATGFAIGATPKYLIVPPVLRSTAIQIRDGSFYVSDSTYYPNPVKGQFEVLVVPYWTTHTTYWFLAADKDLVPMLAVGFLNGNEAPEIVAEVPNTGSHFTADKVYFKVRLVFAVDILDHRGFYGYVG